MKNEIADNDENDEILNIVNEIVEDDKTIKDLIKGYPYPDKIKNLQEALPNFI